MLPRCGLAQIIGMGAIASLQTGGIWAAEPHSGEQEASGQCQVWASATSQLSLRGPEEDLEAGVLFFLPQMLTTWWHFGDSSLMHYWLDVEGGLQQTGWVCVREEICFEKQELMCSVCSSTPAHAVPCEILPCTCLLMTNFNRNCHKFTMFISVLLGYSISMLTESSPGLPAISLKTVLRLTALFWALTKTPLARNMYCVK